MEIMRTNKEKNCSTSGTPGSQTNSTDGPGYSDPEDLEEENNPAATRLKLFSKMPLIVYVGMDS